MANNKKKLILNTVSVDLGCSSCKKPKLSTIFQPKQKSKSKTSKTTYEKHNALYYCSSTSSKTTPNYDYDTATTFSPNLETPTHQWQFWDKDTYMDTDTIRSRNVQGFGRVGGESLAVEKDSDDPYLDFRHSMLQMILEKEIYSKDDLRELLNCFLQLNSPCHHGIIVRAFTEIWNGVFSVRSGDSNSENLHCYGYNYSRGF